jgi:lipopolysaccharide transport system permease protein
MATDVKDMPLAEMPPLVIKPSRGWARLDLRDIWQYRELLYFLTWRDVLIRYKQAVLGVAWAVLNPFITMVVFTVIFGKLLHIPSGTTPYAVFSFTGLVPWQLFSFSTQRAGQSLVTNSNLLTKVYFPRLVIPLSAVIGGLVDFAISFGVLLGLMAYYGIAPTWNILWIPLFTLLALATAFAVSLWFAAANVLYRDVQYIIPFAVQLWMYLSPVIYQANTVPSGKWSFIYGLNPMAGVIAGFRWALLGQKPPNFLLAAAVAGVLVLLITGLYYFRRMERLFADVV